MKWLGKVLLHPKELSDLENIKKRVKSTHGDHVIFELKDSPSSGEIFTKFKELHVFEDIEPTELHNEVEADKLPFTDLEDYT